MYLKEDYKQIVTCVVVVDGVITRRLTQRRRVYRNRQGERFVRSMQRIHPLNVHNEWIQEHCSVPIQRFLLP